MQILEANPLIKEIEQARGSGNWAIVADAASRLAIIARRIQDTIDTWQIEKSQGSPTPEKAHDRERS
jgi:hypothetical protein